jgi:Bacterial SH3 domain
MKLPKLFRFLLGSTLGLVILGIGLLGLGYFVVQRMSALPERPVFENERTNTPSPSPASTSSPTNETPAEATPSPTPTDGYLATVSFSSGLSLRDNPSNDAARIGGVEFNEEVVVLEDSSDRKWQRIRSQTSDLEGWVKAGNLKRVNE